MTDVDESRVETLMMLSNYAFDRNIILGLLKHHPEREDDDALLDEIFTGRDLKVWLSDNESEEEVHIDTINDRETTENERIARQVQNFLGEDMYPFDCILAVVETHEDKNNLEAVMDSVLEQINLKTVSGNWLATNSTGIVNDNYFEAQEEYLGKAEAKEWREEETNEKQLYYRRILTELLATDEQRAAALQIMDQLFSQKYSLETVLCVLRHHPNANRQDLVLRTLEKGIVPEEWFQKDQALLQVLPEVECQICFTDVSPDQIYEVQCDANHRFCLDCLDRTVNVAVRDGAIPKCPALGCDHTLSEKEVNQICGGEIGLKYGKLLLREGLMGIENCVGCPTPGCENWLILPNAGEKISCSCDMCGKSFCSLCRELYHFRVSCEEMKKISMKWLRWGENRTNAEKLSQLRDIKNRIEECNKDEQWKAQNLRCCPRCKRAIEKLDGCDMMKCGQDYHGGNKQKGCGKGFNWSKAHPYVPKQTTDHLLSSPLAIKRSELVESEHDEYLQCDICFSQIEGVRFSCVHCPCFNLCEGCEFKNYQTNYNHEKSHIFDVIGFDFIFDEPKQSTRTSVYERLRHNVGRRKTQLIRAFQRGQQPNQNGAINSGLVRNNNASEQQ